MIPTTSRQIHLRRRPAGLPDRDDFALVERPLPAPQPGQVLVRNLYLSVDPYMRGRMAGRASYMPGFGLDEPLPGGAVGQVVDSRDDRLPAGQYVLSYHGWRDYYVTDAARLTPIDPAIAPPQAYLGVAGMPGLTAYVGLLDIGRPAPGETVFVSAAAGAVGAMAAQIARLQGCRVVGSAGSAAKVAWLTGVAGLDAAFNYKEVDSLRDVLARHCPDGVDVYFDNVGGDHLEAALARMNHNGRIVACGMISQYNATEPVCAPRNLALVVTRRLRLEGFIVSDHQDRLPAFLADLRRWLAEGRIKWEETIVDSLANMPDAFIGLFRGDNLGKMLVRLDG